MAHKNILREEDAVRQATREPEMSPELKNAFAAIRKELADPDKLRALRIEHDSLEKELESAEEEWNKREESLKDRIKALKERIESLEESEEKVKEIECLITGEEPEE